ncbi:MAG: hypothetical protein ACKVRP_01245 [Bacteroidota bacterium]
MKHLNTEILKTLLYYDIWHHPLTARELFTFLPVNSMSFDEFHAHLQDPDRSPQILSHDGYYFVSEKSPEIIVHRKLKEQRAEKMWKRARVSMHIIRRFPFVRGVFVSGDLSKNVSNEDSDIDFFVITEPGRLWIARTLLILFKKIFLLNRKKYFCLNYFATSDSLELDTRSVFTATEIATLKPLYNEKLFRQYLATNSWIKQYFPNYDPAHFDIPQTHERPSMVQSLLESVFRFLPADAIDSYLLRKMERVWSKRYPDFDVETRARIFRCTKTESRAYVGNFEDKILVMYQKKLEDSGIER